ncbi:MAG: hypothetical protein AAF333_19210 [Planctomycetota bacterium]
MIADRRTRSYGGALPGEAAAVLVLLPLLVALLISGEYAQWWGAPRGWLILLDTLCFAGLSAAVAVAAGAVVARAGWAWVVGACTPLVLPASLVGSAWIVALGRNAPLGGWVTVYDGPIAAAVVGLRYAGLAGLILLSQRQAPGPAATVFAARRAWWWLGVRPMLRSMLLAWTVVLLWASAEPILPSMFLIHTYATQVLIQTNALLDPAGAVTLAVPMLLAGGAALTMLMPRRLRWTTTGAGPGEAWSRGGRANGWVRRSGAGAVLLLTMGVPVVALVARLSDGAAFAAAWRDAWPELRHTLWLAGIAAPCCVLLGWLLGSCWRHGLAQRRWTLVPYSLLVLVIPPAVLALGWGELASRWPLVEWRDTSAVLGLAYVLRFAPIAAVVMLVTSLRRSDAPDAAARVHGVPWRRRVLRVTWPTHRRGVVNAAAVCLLFIVTELEMSLLLTPAGTNTIGVRLYTLIHTAPDAQVAATALAALLTFVPLIVVAGAAVLWRQT